MTGPAAMDQATPPTAPTSQDHQERPSWKTEAIRRGNLRITGPAPNELPLIDASIEEDKPLSPKRFTDSHTLHLHPTPSLCRRRLLHKASLDIGNRMGVSSALPTHKRTSTEIQETIMQSSASASASVTPTTPGRASKRQKRGSLSAAIKKIFTSRRRNDRERSRTTSPPGHQYHHSEPLVRRVSPPRTFTAEPRGGTSDSECNAPFPENIGRGTPSQLPFPMNVNAPQDDGSDRGYIAFNRTPPIHRRRATLPSVVFNSTDATTLSAIWSESASRLDDQISVQDDIGIALSSPQHRPSFSSQGPKRRSNRRSRSAGALEELRRMHEQEAPTRDSIASSLWQSKNAGSRPQTSHVPTTEEEEDVMMQDEVFETPGEGVSRASSHDTIMRASAPEKVSLDEDEISAFDFGPMRTGHEYPADKQELETSIEPPFISLDARIERLESNMRYYDESLRRLHGRQNRRTIILENAPPGRGHSRNLSSSSQDSPNYPKRPSIPFNDNQPQVPSPVSITSSPHAADFSHAQNGVSDQSSQPHQRYPSPKTSLPNLISSPSMTTMSSAPTMVATASVPPPSSHSYTEQHSYAPDQMSALYSLLYHERAARKDLETQIDQLRREMGDLRVRVERQYPRNDSFAGVVHHHQTHAAAEKPSHPLSSNLYTYTPATTGYPLTQTAYPTPSPDVSILLNTTSSSSEQLASSIVPPIHTRLPPTFAYDNSPSGTPQRKSHFSLESDDLTDAIPSPTTTTAAPAPHADSGCASARHSTSSANQPAFLMVGGGAADHRSSSVYEEDAVMQDRDDGEKEVYGEPPESPPPRDGEEVFRGIGGVGGRMSVPVLGRRGVPSPSPAAVAVGGRF